MERRDKNLRRAHLSRAWIDDVDRQSRAIDKRAIPGAILLAQHRIERRPPAPIVFGELTVAVSRPVDTSIFVPEQMKRYDCALFPLRDGRAIGHGARSARQSHLARKQSTLQRTGIRITSRIVRIGILARGTESLRKKSRNDSVAREMGSWAAHCTDDANTLAGFLPNGGRIGPE